MVKNFKKSPYKWPTVLIIVLSSIGIVGITNSSIKADKLQSGSALLQTKQSDINYVNIVKKFLTPSLQIVTPGNTMEEDNILLKDLDNDGENEIITAYKSSEQSQDQMSVLILKKVGGNWVKVLDESGVGFDIDLVLTEDIDGDGQNEVLLGRRVGGVWGQLSIYKWNNNLLSKISDKDLNYSKLDIVDIPGKNMKAVATWSKDLVDTYIVDIWKWDGRDFILAKELYPNYFSQSVVSYYEQRVQELPQIPAYWYYLADAQINAGDKNAALDSIEKWYHLADKDQWITLEDKNTALDSIKKGLSLNIYGTTRQIQMHK